MKYKEIDFQLEQQGICSIEQDLDSLIVESIGVQIKEDGRVWVCVNGQAFLRYRPVTPELAEAIKKKGSGDASKD